MKTWLRYALKNLRSGLKGFWILLTCLALGVAAIAIIGSLAAAIERGLSEQGRPLLGGDLEFSLNQREATEAELAFIRSKGEVSRIATLRAMASFNGKATLVEIKAADKAYPLYGTMAYDPEGSSPVSADVGGAFTVAVDPLLLGRLGVKPGDMIKLGQGQFRIGGLIAAEPDRISDGIVLGPRLLMSHEALATTSLIQPGSLVNWRYRVKLAGDASLAAAKAISEEAGKAFPQSGWRVRATDDAAQGAERFVSRLGYFLTLVGIAALVIGGAGIANAVSAFVTRRTDTIATLKCLGVSNRDVLGLFLTEILLVAMLAIALALTAGAAAPALVSWGFSDILPLPIAAAVEWRPLALAGALGLLVTLAFSMLPLARVSHVPGAALFRSHLAERAAPLSPSHLAAALLALAAAALLILVSFDNPWITARYLAGLASAFLLLALLAYVLLRLLRVLPRPRNILLRQALHALEKPGASAVSVILALGLGLTLFVTLALTDRSISQELRAGIPEKAPAFFVLDVGNAELQAFRSRALAEPGVTGVGNAPMLRGRIVSIKGIPADQVKPAGDATWALRGDRGLTYAEQLPEGSTLVSGQWWPKDYAGPPLVSMVDDVAEGLGLAIGNKIVVNVLGRDIEAEIHSLRRVNWRSMGINFVMVFSPNTLQAAPHSHIVTITMEGGDEAGFLNVMAAAFPSATAVRVKDALATVSDLLGKMLAAVRAANALTLLTGILVLSGALAAGLASRSYEAVVLKTYGATRRQLLVTFMIEYGLLGLVAALFGIVVGSLGAWYLASVILQMPFAFSWGVAVTTALVAMVLTISAGLLVTARALSVRPSGYLRNE